MVRRGKRTTAGQLHLYHLQERDARIPMGQVDAVGSEKKSHCERILNKGVAYQDARIPEVFSHTGTDSSHKG